MKSLSKISAVALNAMACMAFAPMAQAQDVNTGSNTLDGSATNSNSNANVSGVNASNTVGNDASAQSGGNVFDFSNNSTPQGYAPALPSFAGGPCMGVSGGVSASLPGFGIGGGRSFDDVSCQRRNWVQTLIGAAERMPETEARELKRVAVVVMMQDPILGPAFKELGYNVEVPGIEVSSAKGNRSRAAEPDVAKKASKKVESSIGSMTEVCSAVVPKNAPASFIQAVEGRGCVVRMR